MIQFAPVKTWLVWTSTLAIDGCDKGLLFNEGERLYGHLNDANDNNGTHLIDHKIEFS